MKASGLLVKTKQKWLWNGNVAHTRRWMDGVERHGAKRWQIEIKTGLNELLFCDFYVCKWNLKWYGFHFFSIEFLFRSFPQFQRMRCEWLWQRQRIYVIWHLSPTLGTLTQWNRFHHIFSVMESCQQRQTRLQIDFLYSLFSCAFHLHDFNGFLPLIGVQCRKVYQSETKDMQISYFFSGQVHTCYSDVINRRSHQIVSNLIVILQTIEFIFRF